ncbi:MAG: ferrous iron transporter B [Thermoanaerobacterales bacterium]|nr:ferrous iron transporter B [Thermoanaerobacterales bacterium]
MSRSDANALPAFNLPDGGRKVVLAGNPNTGKSVFFNALTGLYVDVSNYPGTTLEISHGRCGRDVVVDTPGVYGLSSFNDEERIARDIVLSADLVLNVVNAAYLERDLFLTQQIIDTGVPVIVALNMADEARRQGLRVDVALLSELLGVPVVPTVAVRGEGLEEVKARLSEACPGNPTPGLQSLPGEMVDRVGGRGEALLILEGDPHVAARHGLPPGDRREEIYSRRRAHVNGIVDRVLAEEGRGAAFGQRLGRWMLSPWTGVPILALALWLMYEVIGRFVAGGVVGFTEETVMLGYYEPAVRGSVERFFAPGSAPYTILAGEFGVLTMTVTYVLGLLLPLVTAFYFFLSLFEDSGYLPRVATLADRVLTGIGLNGRAVIPLILGFGCVTMATIVTRLLGSSRERRIAIFLLGLAVPCSAQMAVIASLLAGLGAPYVTLYTLTILVVFAVVGAVLNAVLPGRSTDLLIDLPPLRVPRPGNVLKKTWRRSFQFLREAAPIFALGALIIGTMQVTGALDRLQGALAPLAVGWLHLPDEAATAFLMGIVRRDFGAAGLYTMPLTPLQMAVALTTITLFVPCIASMLVILKELGRGEAVLMWLGTWTVAFAVGGLVAHAAALFPGSAWAGAAAAAGALIGAGVLGAAFCRLRRRGATGSPVPEQGVVK